jgi:hypothetical protein
MEQPTKSKLSLGVVKCSAIIEFPLSLPLSTIILLLYNHIIIRLTEIHPSPAHSKRRGRTNNNKNYCSKLGMPVAG